MAAAREPVERVDAVRGDSGDAAGDLEPDLDRLVVPGADRSGGRVAGGEAAFRPVDSPRSWTERGVYGERAWPTVFGATLVVGAQLWRTDRFGWLWERLSGTRS
ncbi:hypothetical protein LFM09_17985 [Lentzea alba]